VAGGTALEDGISRLLAQTEDQARWAQAMATRYSRLATQLGITATVLAAVATLTALPDGISKWVTAATAFVAALVSGIGTTINPQDKVRALRADYVEWRELQDKVHRLVRRRDVGGLDGYALDRELERLEWQRDNLRRKQAGLDALPEPPQPALEA
jgi:hypothetical protein